MVALISLVALSQVVGLPTSNEFHSCNRHHHTRCSKGRFTVIRFTWQFECSESCQVLPKSAKKASFQNNQALSPHTLGGSLFFMPGVFSVLRMLSIALGC